MKKILLIGAIALSLTFLFMNFDNKASAQDYTGKRYGDGERMGGMRKGLEDKAEFLGMSVEELQNRMTNGETLMDIAGDNFDGLKEFMLSRAQERWAERGLSQEEIDERMQWMQERHENCDGSHAGEGSPWKGQGRGMHRNQ